MHSYAFSTTRATSFSSLVGVVNPKKLTLKWTLGSSANNFIPSMYASELRSSKLGLPRWSIITLKFGTVFNTARASAYYQGFKWSSKLTSASSNTLKLAYTIGSLSKSVLTSASQVGLKLIKCLNPLNLSIALLAFSVSVISAPILMPETMPYTFSLSSTYLSAHYASSTRFA